MPNTKPDLYFDEDNICAACNNFENRTVVDWDSRLKELMIILNKYKNKSENSWDCIVPVSGGKDSTYQVIKILQFGLNPLCVTSTTCDLSDIGRKNIENIKSLGVDYVEISPNPRVRARLNRIGLTEVGDISWPEHVGIFTIPVRAAVQFGVPLIIWGENSQNEYGGPASAAQDSVLTRRWLEEFGGLLGMRVSDLIEVHGIKTKDLIHYSYPSDEELSKVGVTGLFLGHYIPWDGLTNALISNLNGFTNYTKVVEGSIVNYENLDNYQTGIHDYFKFLKFGFGRASDIASLHIRRGRLSRQDAMNAVKEHDGNFPWTYLGKSLESILQPLDIDVEKFIDIANKFTNKRLFKKDSEGNILTKADGSPIKINYDNDDV